MVIFFSELNIEYFSIVNIHNKLFGKNGFWQNFMWLN